MVRHFVSICSRDTRYKIDPMDLKAIHHYRKKKLPPVPIFEKKELPHGMVSLTANTSSFPVPSS